MSGKAMKKIRKFCKEKGRDYNGYKSVYLSLNHYAKTIVQEGIDKSCK